ncbi:hypothetical protein [Mucilaginibacter sp.]|uniref:hypothetical protein n=1 Tax=Mucilaginibacter sp. TaxID=1882438 RepID=UPI003D100BB5
MGQLLRVNFKGTDYSFRVLGEPPLRREGSDIQISIGELTCTLCYQDRQWLERGEPALPGHELTQAIGNAIALRYRI